MKVVSCDICNRPIQDYLDSPSGRIWESISVDFGPLGNENFALCGKCRKAVVEYSGFDKTFQPGINAILSEEE